MPVPELLMWISQYRKTGTLEVRTKLSTERLAFEDGTLTYSSSSDQKKTLGRLLIEKGSYDFDDASGLHWEKLDT